MRKSCANFLCQVLLKLNYKALKTSKKGLKVYSIKGNREPNTYLKIVIRSVNNKNLCGNNKSDLCFM